MNELARKANKCQEERNTSLELEGIERIVKEKVHWAGNSIIDFTKILAMLFAHANSIQQDKAP